MATKPPIFRPERIEQGDKSNIKNSSLRRFDKTRGSASSRGYGSAWRAARLEFLSRNPLCEICKTGCVMTPATVVDHIIPHRGDMAAFWERANWRALCKPCHDKKTLTRDIKR